MALASMKNAEESIANANKYTEEESDEGEYVQAIGLAAERLRIKLEVAIDTLEQAE